MKANNELDKKEIITSLEKIANELRIDVIDMIF